MPSLEYWDSHLHLHPYMPEKWAAALVDNMTRNNVRAGAISGAALFVDDSDTIQKTCKRYPGRLLPMLSYIDLNQPASLDRTVKLLETGEWAGVGELFLEAHASTHLKFPMSDGQIAQQPYPMPKDGARNRVLGGLIRYCAEKDLPILIHCENAAILEELLQRYPETTILWAHCDYVTPLADVRRIFERYPWLMVDFGPMLRCGYWDTQTGSTAWLDTDRPFWRRLSSDYADRLVLGTDTIHEKYCAADRYKHIHDSYADFFSPLDAAKAKAITGGNFKRVFRTYLSRHPEFNA